jgi:hypothetical protein
MTSPSIEEWGYDGEGTGRAPVDGRQLRQVVQHVEPTITTITEPKKRLEVKD